jgi:uncharacterized protein
MRPKHIPQRTCAACREVLPKRSLIRLVRTPEGVVIDPTGKKTGRGAYLHDKRSCWETALKGDLLERALKTEINQDERERLRAHGNNLPQES